MSFANASAGLAEGVAPDRSAASPASNPLSCQPPQTIRCMVAELFSLKYGEKTVAEKYIGADEIPADVLQDLNMFAASIGKVTTCNISAIYPCSTCYVFDAPGNLVLTNHGTQCWEC